MSDSDDSVELEQRTEVVELQKEMAPPGVTGLALAEHYFGPLLLPYQNTFRRRTRLITDAVAGIEGDLGLVNGTLQKCVSILRRVVDQGFPRDADILVRIYSLAAPKYVDVHIKYHHRPRAFDTEWYYSLEYKIQNHISGSPTAHHDPSTNGLPDKWHSQRGWQSICWGYYDDAAHRYSRRRRIEVADVGLYEEGILDVHEALFGPIDKPAGDDTDAVLAYRRKLVATVRLLFAAVGVRYTVPCTDKETDERARSYILEGLSGKWAARGIRAACGFQLSGDAEAARRGEEERREEAMGGEQEEEEEDASPGPDDFSEMVRAAMTKLFVF